MDREVAKGIEWRKEREHGTLVELPSKREAYLRPVDISDLIILGHIPDSLTKIVNDMLERSFKELNIGSGSDDLGGVTEKSPLDLTRDMTEFSKVICASALIYPKVVDDPQTDDEIHFLDILPEDREFIVEWAQNPQIRLGNFRNK